MERIGALSDDFLGRHRPIGQARMLWEIGRDGADVRDLRSRLGLDSGYASRLLRVLERDGLVRVGPGAGDARIRRVTLTDAGIEEWSELDARSDALASSVLEPLSERQRGKLVDALATVERLLTASMVSVEVEDPRSAGARWCLDRYYDELRMRFEAGFDPANSPVHAAELTPPAGLMVVARLRGAPVACGGLRLADTEHPEIKRMWVAPSVRGLGLGRRMLAELERHARESGAGVVRLETNRTLTEAISLYRRSGYVEIPPYNDEYYAHHWFEKRV
jgi:DNA-binding MarR family transcriptional regulator/predicted GNAT family N-acyltransferase